MVEKLGKSWVLLIYPSRFSHIKTDGIVAHLCTSGRLPRSTSTICLIENEIFLPLKSL